MTAVDIASTSIPASSAAVSGLRSAYDLSLGQWQAWLIENNVQKFIASQIMQWIFQKLESDPQKFSNVSKVVRDKLSREFDWSLPIIDTRLESQDGSERFLLRYKDKRLTECVLMPSEKRVTLCVSSQVGCRMACTFCQTGKMGFTRNLTSGEILAQLIVANKRLIELDAELEWSRKVTNIVYMGMGEPLDNFDHVVEACRVMIDDKIGFGLSKHRVTVSTSGLVPEIEKLGRVLPIALAISLHTAVDEERTKLMPVNKTYPLTVLKEALLRYPVQTRHGITFEYVLIKGVNDSMRHAKMLVKFLHGLQAKVNLIPMNEHPGSVMERSDDEHIRTFQSYLSERSIPAPVRHSRGQDVSAACGQLAAKREDELKLPPRTVALSRRKEYLEARSTESQQP